jgi:hypothetical protein
MRACLRAHVIILRQTHFLASHQCSVRTLHRRLDWDGGPARAAEARGERAADAAATAGSSSWEEDRPLSIIVRRSYRLNQSTCEQAGRLHSALAAPPVPTCMVLHLEGAKGPRESRGRRSRGSGSEQRTPHAAGREEKNEGWLLAPPPFPCSCPVDACCVVCLVWKRRVRVYVGQKNVEPGVSNTVSACQKEVDADRRLSPQDANLD